jgi:DNA-binding phage protein
VEAYEKLASDKARLQGFLHETDARLRRYLKTGRYLKESPTDAWAIPYIDAVIEEDKKAVIEAARPKITIDLSGLEQIRRDAATTRESLLTEDEIEEITETAPPADESETSGLPLDPVQVQILRALLEERDAAEILKAHHLMPSMTADAINEALFDEIGDTVLLCEGDQLLLVDDYIEELEQILGGTSNGGT